MAEVITSGDLKWRQAEMGGIIIFPMMQQLSLLDYLEFPIFLPRLLFPILGCHYSNLFVHLLSFLLATCPAHLHFDCLTFVKMSATPVSCLMVVHLPLSCSEIFYICRSIALSADCSLLSEYLVNDQVSAPYVIVGRTH